MAPFPRAELSWEEWEALTHLLMVRSGGQCEIRSPDCLAPRGDLTRLTKNLVSRHHRLARRMGGTTNPAINSLANLLLICGHGTVGCHGWVEHHAYGASETGLAYRLGYLVRQPAPGRATADTDPARVPVLTPSGRWALLHPTNPEMLYQAA
ncbi:hypothetical protein [Microbispora sp. NPDC049125]|uniref:hypothetical protein n=1 Tax=Microbispora sp. NPDC049125 TaxID=3154929 RepID=UPI003465A6F3